MRKSKEADRAYKKAWYEWKKTDNEWASAQRLAAADPERRERSRIRAIAWRLANPERYAAHKKKATGEYMARKRAEYKARDPIGFRQRERNSRVKLMFRLSGAEYRAR